MDFQRTARASSWIWSSIKGCKDSLDRGLCFKIGEGSLVSIKEDPWILDLPNIRLPEDLIVPDNLYRVRDLM